MESNNALQQAQNASAEAAQAVAAAEIKSAKVKEDSDAARVGYDKMMAELTEHICQLTERLAAVDADASGSYNASVQAVPRKPQAW